MLDWTRLKFYGTNLRRLVDEQGIDEFTAVKQLDELYTNNKALDEYNEYVKILDEAEEVGFDQAINNAKERGGGTGIARQIKEDRKRSKKRRFGSKTPFPGTSKRKRVKKGTVTGIKGHPI